MKKILILFILSLTLFSCKKEFEDHNKVSEDVAFNTPKAYKGIVLGMTHEFATGSLYRIIHGPGFTARELGNMNTYETESQLAEGGPELTGVNSSLGGMWRSLHRNRGIAEKILEYIDNLNYSSNAEEADFEKEKVAYKAYAKLMQAITTGYMAQYWEKVTTHNDPEGNAKFVSRTDGLQFAVDKLDEALSLITSNADAETHINGLVSNEFSIVDVINAFKARYEIELGNYQEAYDAADAVNLNNRSVWSYDGGSISNPIYKYTIKPGASKKFRPLDSLGLTVSGAYLPAPADQRVPFYLTFTSQHEIACGYGVDDPNGFWNADTADIPVYLPDEMKLIKAEAKARMGGNANLAEAVALINEVRTLTDVFGVDAGLGTWTGNATNQQEVLNEIYKNYAIELYMQGQRFPIHRRFFPDYLNNIDWNTVDRCSLERVNNFYPYPDQERANNPNCPADPAY